MSQSRIDDVNGDTADVTYDPDTFAVRRDAPMHDGNTLPQVTTMNAANLDELCIVGKALDLIAQAHTVINTQLVPDCGPHACSVDIVHPAVTARLALDRALAALRTASTTIQRREATQTTYESATVGPRRERW